MAQQPRLSTGCLEAILRGDHVDKPVLQVLNIKKIQQADSGNERYRLQLSDGDKYQPCMLATQVNPKVVSKEIHQYCMVMVNRFTCNTIHERKIIIIIELSVLRRGEEVGNCSIGKPTMLEILRVGPTSSSSTSSSSMSKAPSSNHTPMQTYGGHPPQGNSKPATAPFSARAANGNAFQSAAPPNRPGFGSNGAGFKREGGGGGGGGGILSQRDIFPISALSPYQNKWTIRVRAASKPSMRTWSNSRGEGRVFSVDLVDESGEIRASGFNQVADKLYPLFEMGKVYYISRGRLKPANRQYNTTNNQYELSLNEDTEVEPCTDTASDSLPTIQYNFKPIADIESVEPNMTIDVIGVCNDTNEVTSIITKTTNRKLNKRDISLVDRSGHVVSCTLWGEEADTFDGSSFPVVAVKGARVSDFGGRSLSTTFNSVMVVNPDIPEAHTLRGWFDSVGKNERVHSISGQRGGGGGIETPFLVLSQVKELDLGHGEKPDYFSCKGSVVFVRKENCLYKACPTTDCNKKVTEDSSGTQFFCEKCNQNFPNFKYRIILSINVADHGGSQWLTCFQDTAGVVLGTDSQELGTMRDTDEAGFDEVFQKANFRDFIFKIRAKMDVFNDEQRLKCYCVNASPVNYAQETRKCVQSIKSLMSN